MHSSMNQPFVMSHVTSLYGAWQLPGGTVGHGWNGWKANACIYTHCISFLTWIFFFRSLFCQTLERFHHNVSMGLQTSVLPIIYVCRFCVSDSTDNQDETDSTSTCDCRNHFKNHQKRGLDWKSPTVECDVQEAEISLRSMCGDVCGRWGGRDTSRCKGGIPTLST